MKKAISLLLAFILTLLLCTSVFADSITDKKSQLNKVTGNIDSFKNELNKVKEEQSNVSSQISQINSELEQKQQEHSTISQRLQITQNEITDTLAELSSTEDKLAKAQADLAKTRDELDNAVKNLEQQEKENSDNLRAMYINNTSSSYLELLFSAESINDFLNKLFMVKKIMNFEQQVIKDMEKAKEDIEAKKAAQEENEQAILQYKNEIEDKKNRLKEKEKELANTKNKLASQTEEIESKKKKRETLYASLEEEKAEINRQLDELARQSKELETTIQRLVEEQRKREQEKQKQNQNSSSRGDSKGSGQLIWPVPGYSHQITSPYGYRVHPITGAYKFHSGIDIAGYLINHKPVVAADDGVVIMAQWYGGYGNAVIIDHGNGMSTLYAHNSQLTVSVGQSVKRGDIVAKIGTTGLSTGPHLHFEVRINGVTVDPMKYLK